MDKYENNSLYKKIVVPNFNTIEEYNEFIEDLNNAKLKLLANEKYKDAEEVKLKILKAKSYFTKEKIDHFKINQKKQICSIDSDHYKIIENFNEKWKKELNEFETKSVLAIENLKRKNEYDLRRINQEIDNDAKYIKFSSYVEDLIKFKEKLLEKEKFLEAHKINEKIIRVKENEISKYVKIQITRFNNDIAKLNKNHIEQLKNLRNKIELERHEIDRRRLDELNNINKIYKENKILLKVRQRKEKNQFNEEIKEQESNANQLNNNFTLDSLNKSFKYKKDKIFNSLAKKNFINLNKDKEDNILEMEVKLLNEFHSRWNKKYIEFEESKNKEINFLNKSNDDEIKAIKQEFNLKQFEFKYSNLLMRLIHQKKSYIIKYQNLLNKRHGSDDKNLLNDDLKNNNLDHNNESVVNIFKEDDNYNYEYNKNANSSLIFGLSATKAKSQEEKILDEINQLKKEINELSIKIENRKKEEEEKNQKMHKIRQENNIIKSLKTNKEKMNHLENKLDKEKLELDKKKAIELDIINLGIKDIKKEKKDFNNYNIPNINSGTNRKSSISLIGNIKDYSFYNNFIKFYLNKNFNLFNKDVNISIIKSYNKDGNNKSIDYSDKN